MVLATQSPRNAQPADSGVQDVAQSGSRGTYVDTTRCQTYTWDDSSNLRRASLTAENAFALEWFLKDRPFPAEDSVVTKKEIVRTIAEEIGLTQLQTKEIVQKTFDAIVETLVEDHRIELRNFGVFEVKQRAARKARNPRTGEKVSVPEKFVVTFKPGKEMEERVRELERRAAEEHAQREREAEEAAKNEAGAADPGTPAVAATPPSPNGQLKSGPQNNGESGSNDSPTSYTGYDHPAQDATGS